MIKDYDGNLYTQAELKERLIKDIQINIEETKALTKRLEDLEVAFESTKECIEGHAVLEELYEELKHYIPEEKHKLLMKLDDLYMEFLIINEEYFYKQGHLDGRNYNRFLCRLKDWFFKRFFRA